MASFEGGEEEQRDALRIEIEATQREVRPRQQVPAERIGSRTKDGPGLPTGLFDLKSFPEQSRLSRPAARQSGQAAKSTQQRHYG
jgi:hypothetical protein